jgi:LysM repeat protein
MQKTIQMEIKFLLLVPVRGEVPMKAVRQLKILFRAGKLAFNAAIVLVMLAAFLPQTALAATACQSYHTFRSGDTKISVSQFYGFKWKNIAAANDLKPDEKPAIGQALCIPAALSQNKKAAISTSTNFSKAVFLPANESGAVFMVSVSAHQINTTLSDFSSYHVYMVKVRGAGTAFAGWYNLGKVKIITLARQSFSFAVPKDLRNNTNLSVCFKDQHSGELVCRNALNL